MALNVYGCHIFKAQIVATIWSMIQFKFKPFDNEIMNVIVISGFLIAAPLLLTLYIRDYYEKEFGLSRV